RDRLEPALDRCDILPGQDAGRPEQGGMRQGAADVLGGEALVEIDGSVDFLHDLGRTARKAPAPHPVAHADRLPMDPMTASAPRSRRPLLAGAAIAGIIALGAALYGTLLYGSNRPAAAAGCEAAQALAERLAPLA